MNFNPNISRFFGTKVPSDEISGKKQGRATFTMGVCDNLVEGNSITQQNNQNTVVFILWLSSLLLSSSSLKLSLILGSSSLHFCVHILFWDPFDIESDLYLVSSSVLGTSSFLRSSKIVVIDHAQKKRMEFCKK